MPLNQQCSVDAVSANIRQWMKEKAGEAEKAGRSRKELQQQAIAVALSTLKKSCGVSSETRMTPKEIVAAGAKNEEAFGLAGPPKIFSPVRVKPTTAQPKRPVHRKAKSGQEQPFIDPEEFTVQARNTTKPLHNKPDARKNSARASAKESRMRGFSDLMMAALHEDKNAERDGAVSQNKSDITSPVEDLGANPSQSKSLVLWELKSFVLENTAEAHKYILAGGGTGIVYHDAEGRAVRCAVEDMSDDDLLWLAKQKGWKPEKPEPVSEDVEEDDDLFERKTFTKGWKGDLLSSGERAKLEQAIWKKLSRKGAGDIRTADIFNVMLSKKLAVVAGLGEKAKKVNLKGISDKMLARIAKGLDIAAPRVAPAYEDIEDEEEDLEVLDERKAAGHIAQNISKGLDIIAYKYANTSRGGGVDVTATMKLSNPMAPLIVSNLVKALSQRPVDDHIHLSSIITRSVQDAARDSLGVSGRPDRDGEASIDRGVRLLVAYADGRVARVAKRAAKKLRKAKTFDDIGAAFRASA